MKYLVTGGAGFIGSHLCDALLAAGHEVLVIDDLSTGKQHNLPKDVPLTIADCGDRRELSKLMPKVDGVFHLAAIASVERGVTDWRNTTQTNLLASVAVFEAAAKYHLPVIYASSAAIYGMPTELPLSEDAPARPISAYGADKYGCELHASIATHTHGIPTLGMRFFNVYGPRQDPASPYSGVISIFAGRITNGQPIEIHGDGQQTRDFIYVADVVAHLTAGMSHAHQHKDTCDVLNICTGNSTTVQELAEIIAELSEQTLQSSNAPAREGDIKESLGNPNRASTLLDIRAQTELKDGLHNTLAWLKRS